MLDLSLPLGVTLSIQSLLGLPPLAFLFSNQTLLAEVRHVAFKRVADIGETLQCFLLPLPDRHLIATGAFVKKQCVDNPLD